MLLIIDNQSSYIKEFKKKYLEETDLNFIFIDHDQPIVLPYKEKVKGIILSGGKGNPYDPLNLTTNFVALMNYDVPFLGFCIGHEIIAVAYKGRIKRLPKYQKKKEKVIISKPEEPIFNGLDKDKMLLQEKHNYHISELPDCFETLVYSSVCNHEIIRHKEKPLYGFQSHPEVSGEDGMIIIKNFLRICVFKNSEE